MNCLKTSYPRKYQDKTAKLKHKSAEGDEEFHKIMSEIAFVKKSPVPNKRVTLSPVNSLSPHSLQCDQIGTPLSNMWRSELL